MTASSAQRWLASPNHPLMTERPAQTAAVLLTKPLNAYSVSAPALDDIQ
jgi:hypothetical protein